MTGEQTQKERIINRKIKRKIKKLPQVAKWLAIIGFIFIILGLLEIKYNKELDEAKEELLNTGSISLINKLNAGFILNPEQTKKDLEYIQAPQILKDLNLVGCRITQIEDEHIIQGNGSMYATDIACIRGKSFDAYVPNYKEFYVIEKISYDYILGNYIIIKHGKEQYLFGHIVTSRKEGERVEKGDVLGQINKSGVSSAHHLHFELWNDGLNISLDGIVNIEKSEKLKEQRGWIKKNNIMNKNRDKNDERQKWLQYAYNLGGEDFVLTLLAENYSMGLIRKSNRVGANGYSDYGLCQINTGYHPEILSGKGNYGSGKYFVEWFYNPYAQLDYCYKKFAGGTKFYGYYVRLKHKDNLIFN